MVCQKDLPQESIQFSLMEIRADQMDEHREAVTQEELVTAADLGNVRSGELLRYSQELAEQARTILKETRDGNTTYLTTGVVSTALLASVFWILFFVRRSRSRSRMRREQEKRRMAGRMPEVEEHDNQN